MINELRWQLHDLWPDWQIPKRVLIHPGWQTKVARRLQPSDPTVQVQIARDMITPGPGADPHDHRALRAARRPGRQVAPQLLAEKGLGVLIAAKLIGEIAGIDRFTSDAQLARISGCQGGAARST